MFEHTRPGAGWVRNVGGVKGGWIRKLDWIGRPGTSDDDGNCTAIRRGRAGAELPFLGATRARPKNIFHVGGEVQQLQPHDTLLYMSLARYADVVKEDPFKAKHIPALAGEIHRNRPAQTIPISYHTRLRVCSAPKTELPQSSGR